SSRATPARRASSTIRTRSKSCGRCSGMRPGPAWLGGRAGRAARCAAAVAVAALLAGPARADSTWVEHYRAAGAAYAAGDFGGFRAQLMVVRDSIGEQPGINYNLACAAARLGERGETLRRLGLYAASGLVHDASVDSDFVSLWGDAAFRSV